MRDKIPWLDRHEQPQCSNDVVPVCFFQLQTIDDEDDEQSVKNESAQKLKSNQYTANDETFYDETLDNNDKS